MQMSSIILKNITKRYSENTYAVENLNLEIDHKEFLVLVGPSGCGKSTTLRMIAGLEKITDGNLYINDQRVNNIDAKDRNISMVFQNYALYPHMNVYNNMAFGLKMIKYKKDVIKKKIESTAEILDIKNLLYRYPSQLSGGEKQRVALGRAMVREPEVFLFDEPLSNLDAKLRSKMRLEIIELHERLDATFIYVTHDQVEAMTMAKKIVVMNAGVAMQIDTPYNIYNYPLNLFVATFIGSPQMNIIRAELLYEEDKIIVIIGDERIYINNKNLDVIERKNYVNDKNNKGKGKDLKKLSKYNKKEILIGIRPEDILIDIGEEEIRNCIYAKMHISESLGSESYYHFRKNNIKIIVKSNMQINKDEGNHKLKINSHKIHFFDIDNGKNIIFNE